MYTPKELRFFLVSRCPPRHVVRAGLAIAAAAALWEITAVKQRRVFYTTAAEPRATIPRKCFFFFHVYKKRRKPGIWYHTYEYQLLLFSRTAANKLIWLQHKKPQIQAPGTTFSVFGDEVRLEGGHGNWGCTKEPISVLPENG